MRIVHISANAPYNDYWGYHENLLPHYHKQLGHDVTIITTNTMHQNGKIVKTDCADYVLNDGVRVVRLKREECFINIITGLRSKLNVYKLLSDITPDFIFFHGVISSTIFDCIKYKKKNNKQCVIVCDNHLDYYNGPHSKGIKGLILREYYRTRIRVSQKYVSKYYGVTPWRCRYLADFFKVPQNKIELLVMGGDDEHIHFDKKNIIREQIRTQLDIKEDDFVLVSGGKFDRTKNIHILMKAIDELNEKKIKLIVFGKPDHDIENEIQYYKVNTNICYVGWINSDKVYDYFLASDLAVFPGTHSVLWEQAVASGIPCVVKRWEGMEHVDVGGNCIFLDDSDVNQIKKTIVRILKNKDFYANMKKKAEDEGIIRFSYKKIAERILTNDYKEM